MAKAGGQGRESLSECNNLNCTVFVGRLPKRGFDMYRLGSVLSSVGRVAQIIPARDTYLFCEYSAPDEADRAVANLSGYAVAGSRICVSHASSLKRIFVGNLPRTLDARTLQ